MIRVGYPSTLTFFSFYPMWKNFFEELNIELITSPPTTKAILDAGIRETVSDACVPIKLLHGHVLALKDKVDYIFLPRMVSLEKWATFCPKFLGLPDMVVSTLSNIPPLIDLRIDLKKGKHELQRVCNSIGKVLGIEQKLIKKAYKKSMEINEIYQQKLLDKILLPEALQEITGFDLFGGERKSKKKFLGDADINLAVLGYPYQVFDPFISVNLVNLLRELGVKVYTAEMVDPKKLLHYASLLPKKLFWHYSNQVIWSAYYYMEQTWIDGIIHVTAFGCGPDAMVDKLMELDVKNRSTKPFMSVTIDEQSGQAGVMTRLEAFLDMIRFRRDVS